MRHRIHGFENTGTRHILVGTRASKAQDVCDTACQAGDEFSGTGTREEVLS